jgi:hypothetical protein
MSEELKTAVNAHVWTCPGCGGHCLEEAILDAAVFCAIDDLTVVDGEIRGYSFGENKPLIKAGCCERIIRCAHCEEEVSVEEVENE